MIACTCDSLALLPHEWVGHHLHPSVAYQHCVQGESSLFQYDYCLQLYEGESSDQDLWHQHYSSYERNMK